MLVTISKINRGVKETKYGNKRSVGIQIAEDTVKDINGNNVSIGGRWLNCLYDEKKDNGSENWDSGQQVEVQIKVNGEYLNFSPVSGQEADLLGRVKKLEEAVFGGKGAPITAKEEEEVMIHDDF